MIRLALFLAAVAVAQTTRDVRFYSENVQCYAKLYLPAGFSADSKSAAVILAPGWTETARSLDNIAQSIAQKGIVAMAIDYRGWGRSGGYIYLAEDVKFDDRLRFSQHTAKVRIRRKRLIPEDQVDDIRNAISYIQGEPGVDRARIGVLGKDMAAAHALVIAGLDPRLKAAVALSLKLDDTPAADFTQDRIKLARADSAHAVPMQDVETKIALAEYHPSRFLSQIPESTAVLFVGDQTNPSLKARVETVKAASATDIANWLNKCLQ